jgi:hypothetical protein
MRGFSIFPDNTVLGQDITTPTTSVTLSTKAVYQTNCDLILETAGTGRVQISYGLEFDPAGQPIQPVNTPNTTLIYNGPIAAGTSGVYAVNNNYRDELVLKSRALLFSMIF